MKKQRKQKKKSGKSSSVILVAIFFIGLCFLLYPILSDFWNDKRQSRAIINYDDLIVDMTPEDYTEYFSRANIYNQKLRKMPFPFLNHTNITEEYYNTLDVNGDGMMGYLTIEKINLQLPIYHGTSDKVLNSSVGHVEGSSLPVGGESSHSVLSAHRGLPSAKLFTNLDELENGDNFTIRILDQTLTYQVDQILIVEPDENDNLNIIAGGDYCTLLTCTPYSVNTHRLLVRGTRVENSDAGRMIYITNEATQIDPLLVTPIVALPLFVLFLIFLIIKDKKTAENPS